MNDILNAHEKDALVGSGNIPENWRGPYQAYLESTQTGWSGHLRTSSSIVVATGATREETLKRLSEGLYLDLEDAHRDGEAQPTPRGKGKKAVPIYPARPNPLSLAMQAALDASGLSQKQVAERMETAAPNVSRMLDPFYWKHSEATLWKFARALGLRMTLNFEASEAHQQEAQQQEAKQEQQ